MARYIFITGGVVSSLGKGIASASLGALLQARGYSVRLRKLDPYLNVDPGTMSPMQHGEVFVTDDGAETDLDLGHYERFTGVSGRQSDNVTSGRIYQQILDRERAGYYKGGTVQVIPHVTNAIKDFILNDEDGTDFILCEIGGTVGDIEALPFFEAIRQLGQELPRGRCSFLHLTLLPYIGVAGELKTKPTQHSVKELRSIGIQPDVLLCRSEHEVPPRELEKIALFCNVRKSAVIPGYDADSIYKVPLMLHKHGLDDEVLASFGIEGAPAPNMTIWEEIARNVDHPEGEVRIAVVGKYTQLQDAYKSLLEALDHAGIANRVKVRVDWVQAEDLEQEEPRFHLRNADAILVPGGFGKRGSEGKIAAIEFARRQKVPYLGICFGMQMAVVEAARHLLDIRNAGSSELVKPGEDLEAVVGLMTEWQEGTQKARRDENTQIGGTLRRGAYEARLVRGSHVARIYQAETISERHRHRYEVNMAYRERLEQAGMKFSGISPDGKLPEIVEIADHPWFVGVQFHPELKSRPFAPHPLFASFIKAAIAQSRLV